MNAAIFASGQTWNDYLASMRTNRMLMEQQVGSCRLPPQERERWAAATHIAHVLVFTDDACQDSVSGMPPLIAIAAVAPFDLRVLRRSTHADVQRRLSGLAWPPVPMFLFFDDNWLEKGRFVETPQAFRRLQADPGEAIWLRDKAAYDEAWWETEFAELALVAEGRAPASSQA